MRVRRRQVCLIQLFDQLLPDFGLFLRGELQFNPQPAAQFLCPLSGERIPLTRNELHFLSSLTSGTWHDLPLETAAADIASGLVLRGVLISDGPESAWLLQREERLLQSGWNDIASVYSAMTRWEGIAGNEASREHTPLAEEARLSEHVQIYGQAPPHFVHRPDSLGQTRLSLPEDDSLLLLLKQRQTTRAFAMESCLSKADFEYVLYTAFGVYGKRELPSGMTALKRTSPSGGGLHPIDAYVVITKVEGIAPGLYHYRCDVHALDLLKAMDSEGARELITRFTAGQAYFSEAHAAIVHVARFARHNWKYSGHAKAYKAVLMDSAHLSQTLYMAATSRGLGAYYTAAINDADIGADLGLDMIEQGALAVSGFGIKDPSRHELRFDAEPYTPGLHDGTLAVCFGTGE